ncbi:MAG: 23S rRNA pseudouridine(955/2504/2580) synthase RluC [Gammaproteobacteria bacterium]
MTSISGPSVQLLDISDDEAGQRIDNFLMRVLKGVPRSRIYRIIRKGEVRINKGRVKPEYHLQAGDRVRVPPVRLPDKHKVDPRAHFSVDLEQRIIYEDKRLLVIDKPSGLAVHGGSGLRSGLIESLRAQRPDAPYLELVHRLDRATSGCLMIAKKRSELRSLHEMLRNHQVTKKYFLLAMGDFTKTRLTVDAPLIKNQLRGGERVVKVDAQGKSALTRFKVVEKYALATLMEADLASGRTHQIRVHATHVGHPIAGDERYGDADFNREMRSNGLKRLFLHAHFLAFEDAGTGRSITVSCPLADDLHRVINSL